MKTWRSLSSCHHRQNRLRTCSQFIPHCLCHSCLCREGLLPPLTCTSAGCFPQETIIHFSSRILPMGCKTSPVWVSHGHLVQCESPTSQGHRSCLEPAPVGTSYESHSPSGTTTCSSVGLWDHPGVAAASLLHYGPPWAAGAQQVFTMGCRGVSALPGASPGPTALTLMSAGLLLPHTLTPLFSCCCSLAFPSLF